MITVILEIQKFKNYKEETLFLAISLADRYLAKLMQIGQHSPCLIHLSFVCILMAAKMEEPMQPSFNQMVCLAQKEWNFTMTRQQLVEMEVSIIHVLDFDLNRPSPIFFLERFQRLFGLTEERTEFNKAFVAGVAHNMIRCFAMSSDYLLYSAAQIAASAMLFSMVVVSAPVTLTIGGKTPIERLMEGAFYTLKSTMYE